jgi:glycosyltransferase involved in cell wall biosynthesis
VLHVLPHSGGGAERYVEQLGLISGFRFDRLELTRRRSYLELPGGLARLRRAVPRQNLLHIHGDAAALVSLPVIGRRPTVITLHGAHLLRRTTALRRRLARAGLRRAFARSAKVIAVSESEIDFVRSLVLAPASRLVLIHNGVPEPAGLPADGRRALRGSLGVDDGDVLALFVGELTDRKQPVQFARAVLAARREKPAIVGALAGEGPLRAAIEPFADGGLRLLGERDDTEELIAAADVFVLPSVREGLSYAVLEAMALGRAVVVSDGPGNRDAVGDAGIVFPVGDLHALGQALEQLADDVRLRESLGRDAAARARERFSLSEMLERTAGVYEQALAS